jgi:pyruvate kinase
MKLASVEPIQPASEDVALAQAAHELTHLGSCLDDLESAMHASIDAVPEEQRESARNLVHYVALRQHDLRDLQRRLAQLGLSSLGRSESYVRGSLREVARRLHEGLALRGSSSSSFALKRLAREGVTAPSWQSARDRLHQNTRDIFGPRADTRHVYIMVTAPSAHEADAAWMAKMLRANMQILRINCAHEGPEQWQRLLDALDIARRETGLECRVLMDLAGPKIRTGRIARGRRVTTWKPTKDDVGRVLTPARIILRPVGTPSEEDGGAVVLLDAHVLRKARRGDELRFLDARGKNRTMVIHDIDEERLVAHATARAYVLDKTPAQLWRGSRRVAKVALRVGDEAAAIDVKVGDELLLTSRRALARPPRRRRDGSIARRGVVTCTLPEALERLEIGHRVLFDDGRIEAVVEAKGEKRGESVLRVARTQKPIAQLRAEKGINLPDTLVNVPSLTDDDLRALEFVVKHADAVSISFVRDPDDIRKLHQELDRLACDRIGVVLKIETQRGFQNLPRLLLEGLRRGPLAVMIARGDLAVEVGFERMAELQQEILWLCEASHTPTIWATQVLDTLARTGVPSRAEVTDAAASVAAECVMLNKGPFVHEAARVLSDILHRMEKHQYKKRSLFRKLSVSTFVAK